MPEFYQVTVRGILDDTWSDWFNDMEIHVERTSGSPPITTLTGPVTDQARLRGVVSKLWDLNLTIVSVYRTTPEKAQLDSQSGGEGWED